LTIAPVTFNELLIVEAPETNKLVKFVLLFKLVIDNVEPDDNEFKLLNIVVDVAPKLFIAVMNTEFDVVKLANIVVEVAFKLLIDNVELVDNEFKLLKIVVDVVFKLLI
jgi:hypothetical protein